MKRFVNGVETDGTPLGIEVRREAGRLLARVEGELRTAGAVRQGDTVWVSYRGQVYKIERAARSRAKGAAQSGELVASMPGLIVDVLVEPGDTVTKGTKILVLEAMKTQQGFAAPFDGTVAAIHVERGQQVAEGQLLASIEPSET